MTPDSPLPKPASRAGLPEGMDPTDFRTEFPSSRRARRSRWVRHAMWVGLLTSVVLHLLVLFLAPTVTQPLGPTDAPVRVVAALDEFGIRIVPFTGEERIEQAPREGVAVPLPAPRTGVAIIPVPSSTTPPLREVESSPIETGAEAPPSPSTAERMLPRIVDPRLWAPVELQGIELSDIERAELLLGGMIRSWNDSVAIALALSDRATDWTYTDGQGRRWGLSPGRLHLGDFSIPLPLVFRGSAEGSMLQRLERQELEWIRADLERGRIEGEIREVWAERAREMRQRLEAERQENQGTEGSAP